MFGLSSHFEIIDLISNSEVRLNSIGLMGHPCLTPALIFIGGVSSSRDVRTTVVESVYISLIILMNDVGKFIWDNDV